MRFTIEPPRMILENHSKIPGLIVGQAAIFAMKGFRLGRTLYVTVHHTRGRNRGVFTSPDTIALAFNPEKHGNGDWRLRHKRLRDKYGTCFINETWQEQLVMLFAHELRHAWQYRQRQRHPKRRARQKEYDADKHMIKVAFRFREAIARDDALRAKFGLPKSAPGDAQSV